MPRFERGQIVERLQDLVRQRRPIIGGGAGVGISAKSQEAGGIDLIIVYNSGRYRMAGRASSAGLLAYGNANAIVKEMAGEILPVCRTTPVIAGVNGADPFAIMPVFLRELKDLGYSGVQNFPTVGIIDGTFRVSLEETGITYGAEIDLIRGAHALDMLTTPYVFDAEQAAEMTRAGADLIVPHMGVTTGGSIGASASPRAASHQRRWLRTDPRGAGDRRARTARRRAGLGRVTPAPDAAPKINLKRN